MSTFTPEVDTTYGITNIFELMRQSIPEEGCMWVVKKTISSEHTSYGISVECLTKQGFMERMEGATKVSVHYEYSSDTSGEVFYSPCDNNGNPTTYASFSLAELSWVDEKCIIYLGEMDKSSNTYYSYEGWVKLFGDKVDSRYDHNTCRYVSYDE